MSEERSDPDDLQQNGSVGDWCFAEDESYIWIKYPDGAAGNIIRLPILMPGQAGWKWNGDRTAPTLTPKIDLLFGKKCRMTAGKLEEA